MGLERVRQVVDAGNALGSDLTVVLGDYFATHRFVTERVPHAGLGGGTGAAEGAARRLFDPRQSRLVVRHQGRAPRARQCAHAGDGERRRAARASRAAASGWPASATRSPIGSARADFSGVDDLPGTLAQIAHRRSGDPARARARHLHAGAGARVAHASPAIPMAARSACRCVPPVWAPSAYGARFAYGHIVERGRHMIVSGGLGCSKVPLRLGVPPEIVRIDWAERHSTARSRASGNPALAARWLTISAGPPRVGLTGIVTNKNGARRRRFQFDA